MKKKRKGACFELTFIKREVANDALLTMVNTGEPSVIKKVGGKEETRRFLEKSWICARRNCDSCF